MPIDSLAHRAQAVPSQLQFNGTIVLSPVRSIPPLGTKTSSPTEPKVMGTQSNIFASELHRLTVREDIPISTPCSKR